jgi:hypothetical protein
MPRYGETLVYPDPELEPFLRVGVNSAITDLCIFLNKFEFDDQGNFEPPPFGTIPDLLNQKCPEEVLMAHPVGGPLARTMGRISLSNMDLRYQSTRTAHSLKNETAQDFLLEPHRDLLDGHAVLFNYAVSGDLAYLLNGERHPLKNNELIVLNGAAEWGDITNLLPGKENSDPFSSWRSLGGVTMVHSVVGKGFTSRNRLLVYADGCKTSVTQIPPELPPWF